MEQETLEQKTIGRKKASDFPQELLHESRQVAKPTTDQLRVEGWRNSWFSRLVEMLTGED